MAVGIMPLLAQTPTVAIDGPSAGAIISGTVTVSGWAIDNATTIGTAISSVQVMVDGTAVGNATYGISRPDVCTAYPGRAGCPNVGYVFSLNATALSPGLHTITVAATDSNGTPDVGSSSVQVAVGPPPMVAIDSPTAGSVLSGTVTVSGWALDTSAGGTLIHSVQVLVDGVAAGTATYGSPRSDVCALYPSGPNCPNVGYTFSLNTASYTPGAHTITVSATDSAGNPETGSLSVPVTVMSPPTVMIDSLTAGQMVSGIITVSGWAIDNSAVPGSAIGFVQILVDGSAVGIANYGASRPDVCATYPGRPGCPNVGFTFTLDTTKLSAGIHTLTASATDTSATPETGTWTMNISVTSAPSVVIESPTSGGTVSGRVVIQGWALDNTASVGTAISSLKMTLDGSTVLPATYGTPRPDICNTYPGRPGCPNVGFSYTLDTSTLATGSHTISVTATDSDATPESATSTVTFSVGGNGAFNLETPTNGAMVVGTVTISGWAIAPNGTLINSVKLFVDGVQSGQAFYGEPRPDVCGSYPGAPGCPYVGFTVPLNTLNLSDGPHQITVTALTQDGQAPVGSGTVTITVNN